MKVLIADDHPIIRLGIKKMLLEAYGDIEEIVEVNNCNDLQEIAVTHEIDLIITEIILAERNAMLFVKEIKNKKPKMPILVISNFPPDSYSIRLLRIGISAYLTKDCEPSEIIKAIAQIRKDKRYMTDAIIEVISNTLQPEHNHLYENLSEEEIEIFRMLISGKTALEISNRLMIKKGTVNFKKKKIKSKLNVQTNFELLKYAISNNIAINNYN